MIVALTQLYPWFDALVFVVIGCPALMRPVPGSAPRGLRGSVPRSANAHSAIEASPWQEGLYAPSEPRGACQGCSYVWRSEKKEARQE